MCTGSFAGHSGEGILRGEEALREKQITEHFSVQNVRARVDWCAESGRWRWRYNTEHVRRRYHHNRLEICYIYGWKEKERKKNGRKYAICFGNIFTRASSYKTQRSNGGSLSHCACDLVELVCGVSFCLAKKILDISARTSVKHLLLGSQQRMAGRIRANNCSGNCAVRTFTCKGKTALIVLTDASLSSDYCPFHG